MKLLPNSLIFFIGITFMLLSTSVNINYIDDIEKKNNDLSSNYVEIVATDSYSERPMKLLSVYNGEVSISAYDWEKVDHLRWEIEDNQYLYSIAAKKYLIINEKGELSLSSSKTNQKWTIFNPDGFADIMYQNKYLTSDYESEKVFLTKVPNSWGIKYPVTTSVEVSVAGNESLIKMARVYLTTVMEDNNSNGAYQYKLVGYFDGYSCVFNNVPVFDSNKEWAWKLTVEVSGKADGSFIFSESELIKINKNTEPIHFSYHIEYD